MVTLITGVEENFLKQDLDLREGGREGAREEEGRERGRKGGSEGEGREEGGREGGRVKDNKNLKEGDWFRTMR